MLHKYKVIFRKCLYKSGKKIYPHKGIWIGHCCFIRYGSSKGKLKTPPPLPPPYTKNDYYNSFCCCCFGRRLWVFTVFVFVLFLAVLVFFFWPRLPLIRVEGAINTIPTKVTQTQQGGKITNVAFETAWLLNITMDNRRNYFTTRFNKIQIIVKDALTGLLIGKGVHNTADNSEDTTIYLPGYTISTIQLPISISYQARDNSDTTFSNLIRACVYHNMTIATTATNSTANFNHHSLSIQFWFTAYIFGLDWIGYKPTVIATPAAGGFFCPS